MLIISFLHKLITPLSNDEDKKRQEFILNVIILASIFLIIIVNIILINKFQKYGQDFKGLSPIISLSALGLFITLYIISRKGYSVIATYIFIAIFFIANTYMVYKWGIDLPAVISIYALIIIMTGILIGTRFALIITFLIIIIYLSFNYLQANSIIQLDIRWKKDGLKISDNIAIAVIFGIISTISWLHNREIKRALKRCLQSETTLQKERDSLEIKIDARTKELKQVQLEKVSQLYRLAEFGRLTSGLLHDLINPLNAISLNLNRVKNGRRETLAETRANLERAFTATQRMEDFILAARKQIAKQENKTVFSLTQEIIQVIQILDYKAKKAQVDIFFAPAGDITTYGDSIKFSQVATNLIANAIDAYDQVPQDGRRREVEIKLYEKNNTIHLVVQDWGCGIFREKLSKIFDPFYTTKDFTKGTGIGLSSVKGIIKKNFKGRIKVGSRERQGSIFIIWFPKQKIETNNKFIPNQVEDRL